MLKVIFSVFLLLSFASAKAQIFSPSNPKCEAPNSEITVEDLQHILMAAPSINGCDVYEVKYIPDLSLISGNSEDSLVPLLVVKMINSINTDTQFSIATDIFALRGNVPLCIERHGLRETISYKYETSKGDGIIDYFTNNLRSSTRRIYFEFTNGQLNMAEQELINTEGGILSQKQRQVFKCGALSPVDVAVPIETAQAPPVNL